jgi:hypothetical protein
MAGATAREPEATATALKVSGPTITAEPVRTLPVPTDSFDVLINRPETNLIPRPTH